MKKNIFIIGSIFLGSFILVAIVWFIRFNFTSGGDVLPNSNMAEQEARTIAEATCIKGAESLASGTYNAGTKTWWYDANLNATREGCSPACVVNEISKTAEINWRCTGVLSDDVKKDEQVFCTMEAKLCPDGSYVSRGGPNCEFAVCPETDAIIISLTEELKKIFTEKYPNYKGTMDIRIDQQTETHVRGGISFVDDQAGGIFLAAKINKQWQIISDGNGAIACSYSKYGFPAEMLSDCVMYK
jgi:hypothetical protein